MIQNISTLSLVVFGVFLVWSLIDSYDEEDDFAGKLIEKATINLPNTVAAIDLQRQLMLNSEIAPDAADGDPDNLQTPLYDAATQSYLTHVFDVLEAGGIEGTPKSSSIRDKSVRKFTRDMMNGKIGEEEVSEVVEEFEDNKAQSKAGGEARLADDDGGHLVGHRFMSDQGEKNLFPQNSNFNRGSYKSMENEWADWTDAGYEVKLKVSLEPPGSARPTDVISEYEVCDPNTDDVVYEKRHKFNNQSGETFGRVTKKDIEKLKGLL